MRRLCLLALVAALLPAAAASADEPRDHRLGGFFGVRLFSGSSSLGTPTRTSLASSVLFGVRGVYPWKSWLSFEAELPLVITGTRDDEATVLFTEPRLQALVERRLRAWLRPFVTAGIGGAATLSSDRPHYASDLQPVWHLGAGVKLDRPTGLSVRIDLRVPVLPRRGDGVFTPELELMVSLYRFSRRTERREPEVPEVVDSDGDGLADADDQCPDRHEDRDGFEDDDGCPDIDDDRDEVLDIADRCRLEPETWNGYRDDDGCPDAVPGEVAEWDGVLEGVTFRPSSAVMSRRSHRILDRLAAILVKYPSVRGRVIGHTDDTGDADANLDLSQRRAEAVRFYLIARGVEPGRLAAVGVGASAPLADNDSRRGRAKNRRVEFQIRRRDR